MTDFVDVRVKGVLFARINRMAEAWDMDTPELISKLLNDGLAKNDQTEDKWLWEGDLDELGTGIFLLPDVMSDEPGTVKKVLVPHITYRDYLIRAAHGVSSGKWVPHRISSYEELSGGSCSL